MRIDGFKWALEDQKYLIEDENRVNTSITLYFLLSIVSLWIFWSLI